MLFFLRIDLIGVVGSPILMGFLIVGCSIDGYFMRSSSKNETSSDMVTRDLRAEFELGRKAEDLIFIVDEVLVLMGEL
jgi:hypothetical protein